MREGQDILGIESHPEGVSSLYLQAEIADALMWKRASSMFQPLVDTKAANGNRQPMYIWNTMRHNLKLDTDIGLKTLDQTIERLMPLDVIAIDPLYKFLSFDITSPVAVGNFQDYLDKLIAKYGVSLWIVAHPRKPPRDGIDAEGSVDDLLGASTWANWADTVLKVVRPKDQPQDTFIIKNEGVSRHSEEGIPDIVYRFDRAQLGFHQTILI
jgi:RecA-family ATPase